MICLMIWQGHDFVNQDSLCLEFWGLLRGCNVRAPRETAVVVAAAAPSVAVDGQCP